MPKKSVVALPAKLQRILIAVVLSVLAACTSGQAVLRAPAQSERSAEQVQRIAYVDSAIKIVRDKALFADRVDWPSAQKRLHDAALSKSSTYALYADLEWLLDQLRDNHSFLQLGAESAQRYRSAMGVAFQSSVTKPKMQTRFPGKRPFEAKDQGRLRWVTVPSMMGDEAAQHAYARTLARALGQRPNPCGIILDFRGNGGGNMWPMLAGLSPLFSSATLGAFVEPSTRMGIAVRSGALLVSKDGAEQQVFALDGWRANARLQSVPVAILLDGATGSSGEIVPLLLSARQRVRTFGQETYGASTSTEGFELSDGANLVIVTAGVADARGTLHLKGLSPDHPVAYAPGPDAVGDPDAAAAKSWLGEMTCR